MLNIGIIGSTDILEPHVRVIQKNKQVNVIGKASIGRSAQLNSFHFSIPEFNRVELIERADVLIIDNSSMLPFEMLCDIVKKGKHVFAVEYPELTMEECDKLLKLTMESGSVVHISNKIYHEGGFSWLRENRKKPVFIDILKDIKKDEQKNEIVSILLLLNKITGVEFKRLTVTAFDSQPEDGGFLNIRMDFGNASAVNINLKSVPEPDSFHLNFYSIKHFGSYDIVTGKLLLNGEAVEVGGSKDFTEFDHFIASIRNGATEGLDLTAYQGAVRAYEAIRKKMELFEF